MRHWRVILIVVAVVSIGVALSYPIRYRMAEESNNSEMEELSAMRSSVLSQMNMDSAPTGEAAEQTGNTAEATVLPDVHSDEKVSDAEAAVTSAPVEAKETFLSNAKPEDAQNEPLTTAPSERTQAAGSPGPTLPPAGTEEPSGKEATDRSPMVENTPETTPSPVIDMFALENILEITPRPRPAPQPTPVPTPEPTPLPDWSKRTYARAYTAKDKIELSEDEILPELKEIYALNDDLIGWLVIPGTIVDYPVVQNEDNEYYLHRDFYGAENSNGQIILDVKCDPYTPSYNLIVSGHHMNNGSMFGSLTKYSEERYWDERKFVEFDTLVERKQYVIFAAFYSADYDEDEEGFRYNADIRYKIDADQWLEEIRENQIYDTGIDAEFGDEFLTLTTCCRTYRRNGRFVLVCRKIREGEIIK